jgi:RHS repeat-associated protein
LSTVRHINFRNAEYDVSNVLRRKYIYGPCTDEPISMIEAAGSYAGTYYYHFDGLGSVVGLTNSSGNTVEVYEYDVYGRLGATDASHPNRILFTGREYDRETGLYYYRARYYNPQIGRFLQTDPIGYADGMNMYAYCQNRPAYAADPLGLAWEDPCNIKILLVDNSEPTMTTNVDTSYWDIVFDISGLGTEQQLQDAVVSDMSLIRGKVEAAGLNWSQVQIGGIWFMDHGWLDEKEGYVEAEFGNCNLWAGEQQTTKFFTAVGGALDSLVDDNGCHKAANTTIHLRQCYAGGEIQGKGRPLLEQAAEASGHSVTGAAGQIYALNDPFTRPGYWCPTGYFFATPNKDGSVTTGSYYGYCYHRDMYIDGRWVLGRDHYICY